MPLISNDRPPDQPEAAVLTHQYSFLHAMEVDAFNMPVYQSFGDGRPMFVAVARGVFNPDALLRAFPGQLWRSAQLENPKRGWAGDGP